MHRVEFEQLRLNEELDPEATVLEAVAHFLGVEPSLELSELIMRQFVAAEKEVPRFERAMRSTRRAAMGCGFIAGVAFARSVQRAGGMDSAAGGSDA